MGWVPTGGGSSPLTTKGDLHVYTTDDARLAVGTNDHVLTADSGEASGVKWAAAPGGGTPTFSGCRVTNNGDQSITSAGVWVTWDTEEYDTDSYHEGVTNPGRLTVPSNGYYAIGCGAIMAAAATSWLLVNIEKQHGTILAGTGVNLGIQAVTTISTQAYLTSGQYVEVRMYSASTKNLVGYGTYVGYTNFWIARLGT